MTTYEPHDIGLLDSASIKLQAIEVLDAHPQEVWATILDYPKWTSWFPGMKSCRATSNPSTGVGSTREVKLTGGVTIQERFIVWNENETWAFTATAGPPVFEGLVEQIEIREVAPGRSQITYRMAIQPRRWLRIPAKMVASGVRKNLTDALRAFPDAVERRR